MSKKTISIIVPLHNEEANIRPLYQTVLAAMHGQPYALELILVDDGSTDTSARVAKELARTDNRVRLLEFARNFGKEAAVSAGIHASRGDAVVMMDADLQHPPALLPQFIAKWEQGSEVVVGVRDAYKKQGFIKELGSKWFYRIMQCIAHTHITPHATDYRLLDRCVVEEFNQLTERNRMTRGLLDWLGFRRDYVSFVAPERQHGEASYTVSKLIGLAINSVTSYSLLPLRLAGYLGGIILFISAPLGIFVVVEKYVLNDPWGLHFSGPAILAIVLLFLVGVMLACLGLVAMYIAHIHTEVVNRPLYIVRKEQRYASTAGENI